MWGVKIVTPENINEDEMIYIDVLCSQSSNSSYTLKIEGVPKWSKCWLVTFQNRLEEPYYISGRKLHQKVEFDEVLAKVDFIKNKPDLIGKINEAIDEKLKNVINVTESRGRYSPASERSRYGMEELEFSPEIPIALAQKTYLYIDDTGNVRDGGYRYVIDVPAFVESTNKK